MSQPCEEPRFTIEQIDLLQRLWRTGMTQAEMVHALDTLERLDRQQSRPLNPRPRPPPPRPSSSSVSTTSTATQTCFPGNGSPPTPGNSYRTSPPLSATVPTPVAMAAAENGLLAMANGKLSPPRFPAAVVGGGVVAQSYGFETSEEEAEIDEKVEELMRMDSTVVKEELKDFLGNRRISQAVVAQVTGISQSRISHWLVQQGSDLSDQKKRAFFRWYLLEKTNPGATLTMRPTPLALEEMVEWHQAPPSFGPTPGSSRLRRGSRFTWRKECLSVMESYFGDNQYPDEGKREEIASACNAVIQKPGKKLSDLERVTSLKVYNWFANRRKDMKRRANIAILESHGMDVVSPGGQSNSDEVDGNEFPEQGSEVSVFERKAAGRAFGPGRIDLSSPTQDEPTSHNSPAEIQDPISLAVEMAAVNHSILALANQATEGSTGNYIKTEAMEDD